MLPVLLGLGGFFWLYHHHHKTTSSKPVPPAIAAVHGDLMQHEYQPNRLESAAKMFGSEGFPSLARELASKASQIRQQAAAVPDIVERARAGDQNAMAMITACRENAAAGSPRAHVTCALIEQYCHAHPPAPKPGEAAAQVSDTPAAHAAAA